MCYYSHKILDALDRVLQHAESREVATLFIRTLHIIFTRLFLKGLEIKAAIVVLSRGKAFCYKR
ncbi:hypothetical protein APHCR_0409 [Anaplasma phagocytophilum str. CR1007]|nr:hypothetical protein YYU_04165 [Anaplasma phagocytophilum str. HZ2]AGR80803.1 hypothetical protein WSQ_04190 [Anaplasma phagocytophilum str. JM]AGR82055.1 hypothetical protein YYY_04180 [Anaplasma phagocytophilum str. Dog2]EOA61163.1 hypothetical protein HGE1_03887 [Anaplasma phagocytophilum str. HGE1]KJV63029.1 hypothetical protein EPHNCH_1241 [Anaplasma phagocytophilum str. NCH-1]KJZ98589.1 hypothetical protein APHCR_0409 [Anaplasma phagocytophilum str. CR1007]KKA00526.1 hypothetical pro